MSIYHDDFAISKVILQNKIKKISDQLHNEINKIKTEEELVAFINERLDINIKDHINI